MKHFLIGLRLILTLVIALGLIAHPRVWDEVTGEWKYGVLEIFDTAQAQGRLHGVYIKEEQQNVPELDWRTPKPINLEPRTNDPIGGGIGIRDPKPLGGADGAFGVRDPKPLGGSDGTFGIREPRPLAGLETREPRPLAGLETRQPRPLAGLDTREPRPLAGLETRESQPLGNPVTREPYPIRGLEIRPSEPLTQFQRQNSLELPVTGRGQ
jgi:hypothetical protein